MGAAFTAANPLRVLLDPATLVVLLTVFFIDVYTVYRAHEAALRAKYLSAGDTDNNNNNRNGNRIGSAGERFVAANAHSIDGRWMWCLPIMAALTLIALFFLMPYVGTLLIVFTAVAAAAGLTFVLLPFASYIVHIINININMSPNADSWALCISASVAVAAVLGWFYSGYFMLNNLLAFSLCVLFGVIGRIRSFRSLVILFVGLYLYDVFFVFFSPYFFSGKNVMVQVATTAPNNPAYVIANFLLSNSNSTSSFAPVKRLALPSKLIFPSPNNDNSYSILGLGDIVLPIVLLVYLMGIDLVYIIIPSSKLPTFFIRALLAHMLGLFMSFYCNITFKAPQPALFYIVPSMLILTAYTAHKKRLLTTLWNDVPHNNSSNSHRGYQELPDSTSPDKDSIDGDQVQ